MKRRKTVEKTPREWTQRAKPTKAGRRNRRIGLAFLPEDSDRLATLAKIDGISVNHVVENLVRAEYSRRLADPATAALIRAFEKLNPPPADVQQKAEPKAEAPKIEHTCVETSTGTPIRPFLKMKK